MFGFKSMGGARNFNGLFRKSYKNLLENNTKN